ncbi:MAG TPA: DUF4365 domain-containing protein [Allosphingosinicella sp.]
MGYDRIVNGNAGEGLFQYLAGFLWRAEVRPQAQGQGTDGELCWPDLPVTQRLLYQVKSRRTTTSRTASIRVPLTPSEIRGWAARRPILIVCDLNRASAWWLDTTGLVPSDPQSNMTLKVPKANRVDASGMDAIRRIAVERWYESVGHPKLPKRLRNLRPDKIERTIKNVYLDISSSSGIRRDVIAMAVTRLLRRSGKAVDRSHLDVLLNPMIERVNNRTAGGRSHSLSALLALLLPDDAPELRTDQAAALADIAEYALFSRDFVHSEFGLVLAAKLAEVGRPTDIDRFHDFRTRAVALSQGPRFYATVGKLDDWEPGRAPLSRIFALATDRKELVRPTAISDDVFNHLAVAKVAVDRALAIGAANVSPEELVLIDQWTRYHADQYFYHDLGRELGGLA